VANAVEMFKQQKAALEELQRAANGIEVSLVKARAELDALARHDALKDLLLKEQVWLQRTEAAVHAVSLWRAEEARRHWPQVALRWVLPATFALLVAAVAGAGHARAAGPYLDEIAYLRARSSFAEALETRMLRMTPAERRQLDMLLKLPTRSP